MTEKAKDKSRTIECVRYYRKFVELVKEGAKKDFLDADTAKQFEAMLYVVEGMANKEGIATDDIDSKSDLTLDEYQSRAMTTCMKSSHNISYMVHGLCEESGEVAGKISKAIRKGIITINGNHLYQTSSTEEQFEEFEENLKKEVGDCAWMLAGICDVMRWSLVDVCQLNLDKLQDRQKRGVIDSKGDNR